MITESYRNTTEDIVLSRLSALDEILNSDTFLIGLSDQAPADDIVQSFNVVNDLVLGLQLCSHDKKPRAYKGEFSSFYGEVSWISRTAASISGDSRAYLDAGDLMYKVQNESNLHAKLREKIRTRAAELNFTQSWGERLESSSANSDMSVDGMLETLEVMVESYFQELITFAIIDDFDKVSLCSAVIEQLQCGGMPCGWLSKSPYWDLSEWASKDTGVRRGHPSLTEGIFADPREHLAMLYLD